MGGIFVRQNVASSSIFPSGTRGRLGVLSPCRWYTHTPSTTSLLLLLRYRRLDQAWMVKILLDREGLLLHTVRIIGYCQKVSSLNCNFKFKFAMRLLCALQSWDMIWTWMSAWRMTDDSESVMWSFFFRFLNACVILFARVTQKMSYHIFFGSQELSSVDM